MSEWTDNQEVVECRNRWSGCLCWDQGVGKR